MKKILFTTTLIIAVLSLSAQTINVHFKNGTKIQYPSDNVDYVDFSEKADNPSLTAGKAVDLGLSVFWASCNLGADSPEESGSYYAFGETSPKSNYTRENYVYYDETKGEYINIGSNIAGTEYDAAHVNLGGHWSIPTRQQFQELLDKCTWEYTQVNNVNGYRVTGKNGNSIFIPLSGRYTYILNRDNEEGHYWTSTSDGTNAYEAILQRKSDGNNYIFPCSYFNFGHCIRPVTTYINDNREFEESSITLSYRGGSISMINGIYQSGSQLNFTLSNSSSVDVTLTGVYLKEEDSDDNGNNSLSEYVSVKAGESKSYTITLGKNMSKPQAVFTYLYNNKSYTVKATAVSFSF